MFHAPPESRESVLAEESKSGKGLRILICLVALVLFNALALTLFAPAFSLNGYLGTNVVLILVSAVYILVP